MILPDLAGERKTVGLISPRPNALGTPGAGEGWLMMGMMVRVIRFQFSFRLMGMTGWTLRLYCVVWFGPTLKLKLFWKGTLMSLATGFCASLASSSVLSPPPVLPETSCAMRFGGTASKRTDAPRTRLILTFIFFVCRGLLFLFW